MWRFPTLLKDSKNWTTIIRNGDFFILKNIKISFIGPKQPRNIKFLAYDYPEFVIVYQTGSVSYVISTRLNEAEVLESWLWLENNISSQIRSFTSQNEILELFIVKANPTSDSETTQYDYIIRSHPGLTWDRCVPIFGAIHLTVTALCFDSDSLNLRIPWEQIANVQTARETELANVVSFETAISSYRFTVLEGKREFKEIFDILLPRNATYQKIFDIFQWQEIRRVLHLPSNEVFFYTQNCYILRSDEKMHVDLIISNNFLTFVGNEPQLKCAIPFTSISQIEVKEAQLTVFFHNSSSELVMGDLTKEAISLITARDFYPFCEKEIKKNGKYYSLFEIKENDTDSSHKVTERLLAKFTQFVWTKHLNYSKISQFLSCTSKTEIMARQGIPDDLREKIWMLHSGAAGRLALNRGYYEEAVKMAENEVSSLVFLEIEKDLPRTMPDAGIFSVSKEGIEPLRRVLMAFAWHNKKIGYCQAMNCVVAMLLLFCGEESSFWLLIQLCENHGMDSYYCGDVSGGVVDCDVLRELVMEYIPALKEFASQNSFVPISISWFMTLYVSVLEPFCAARIFDCFFCGEGPLVLFRVALQIYKNSLENFSSDFELAEVSLIMSKYLKRISSTDMGPITVSIDSLLKSAFSNFRDFTAYMLGRLRAKYVHVKLKKNFHENLNITVKNMSKCSNQFFSSEMVSDLLLITKNGILRMQSFSSCQVSLCDLEIVIELPELHFRLDYPTFQYLFAELSCWYRGKTPELLSYFLFSLIEEDKHVSFLDFVLVFNVIFGDTVADKFTLFYQIHLLPMPMESEELDCQVREMCRKWLRTECRSELSLKGMSQGKLNRLMNSLMDLVCGHELEAECQLGLQNVIMLLVNKLYAMSPQCDVDLACGHIVAHLLTCESLVDFFSASICDLNIRLRDLLGSL